MPKSITGSSLADALVDHDHTLGSLIGATYPYLSKSKLFEDLIISSVHQNENTLTELEKYKYLDPAMEYYYGIIRWLNCRNEASK